MSKNTNKSPIKGFDGLCARVARHDNPAFIGAQIMWAVMVLLNMDRVPLTKDSSGLRDVINQLKPDLAARLVDSLHRVLDALIQGKIPNISMLQTEVKPEMIRRAERFMPGGSSKKALKAAEMGYMLRVADGEE